MIATLKAPLQFIRPRLALIARLLLFGSLAASGLPQTADLNRAGQTTLLADNVAEARAAVEQVVHQAGTGAARAEALISLGQALDAERKYPAARSEYGKALGLAGITMDQKARALCAVGATLTREGLYAEARAELEKVLAMPDASATRRVQAQIAIGQTWAADAELKLSAARKAYATAKIAYAKVPDIPGVSPSQQADAHLAAIRTLLAMKNYAEVRAELTAVLEIKDLPSAVRARAQVALGKAHLLERNYAVARSELASALAMEGIAGRDRADAQLHIGLSCYDAQDFEQARPELQKVLTMPEANADQVHEANLRLRLRKLVPAGEKALAVLFIGASHTQGWNIPQIVERLAASAPAGRPRIVAGGYLRGGTGIDRFWEEGKGHDTLREKIAAEPWDAVVFESYPLLFGRDQIAKYAAKIATLARAGHAVPVLFDAPPFFRMSYPAECRTNHNDNVAIARALQIPVAAAGGAWMNYLGLAPTPEERMKLYVADAVHTSKKGGYMLACSIYSAVTGHSPVGLTHTFPSFGSDGLTEIEASQLQAASWKAFQEANPNFKPSL